MPDKPLIHRFSSAAEAALANAYLVETATGVVAVDSMLTVSDSRRLRARQGADPAAHVRRRMGGREDLPEHDRR